MGQFAPRHMEHSLIPGQCRHGRWPDDDPRSQKSKAAKKEENLLDIFKREALTNRKIAQGIIISGEEIGFDNERAALFKYALYKTLEESMAAFEKKDKEKDYIHWVRDPVTTTWLRLIFQDYIKVAGICAHLQPWTKPVPTPHLKADEAFLRLMVRGKIESWRLLPMEDLRELSHHQCHEPVDFDEDWLVCIFGSYPPASSSRSPQPTLPGTPAPRTPTPGTPGPSTPAPGTPAAPPVQVKEEPIEEFKPLDDGTLPVPYEDEEVLKMKKCR